MYERSQEKGADVDLSSGEISWILGVESNETTVLRISSDPHCYGFSIRTGNYITLAELFHFGSMTCSCYDLYRSYLSMAIYIHKR